MAISPPDSYRFVEHFVPAEVVSVEVTGDSLRATLWEIPAASRADMCVPARVFADRELLEAIKADRALEQLQNVATLPGIVDEHWQCPMSIRDTAFRSAVWPQPRCRMEWSLPAGWDTTSTVAFGCSPCR
jgi:hypothetical protein